MNPPLKPEFCKSALSKKARLSTKIEPPKKWQYFKNITYTEEAGQTGHSSKETLDD